MAGHEAAGYVGTVRQLAGWAAVGLRTGRLRGYAVVSKAEERPIRTAARAVMHTRELINIGECAHTRRAQALAHTLA